MPFDGQNISAAATVLIEARARISDPAHWCRGEFYRDGAHCAVGAITLYRPMIEGRRGAFEALMCAARARGWRYVAAINDAPDTTHADVMALYDEAIALALTDE